MFYRLVLVLSIVLLPSVVKAEGMMISTQPITIPLKESLRNLTPRSPLVKAGIYDMGGKLFIDRNLEVSKGVRADRYIEMVSTTAPLPPESGFARFYLSNSSNTLCAEYSNGGIGCFGFNNTTGTVTSSSIIAHDPIYYNISTGDLTLGAISLSTGVTGILPDGKLSSNVALLNATQTFTGANTFRSSVTIPNVANSYLAGDGNGVIVSTTITKLGTVNVGTWNGSVINTQYGGTGANLSAAPAGALTYFTGNGGPLGATSTGTLGQYLQSGGSFGTPTWVSTGVFIANTSSLQTGATFYVSSGTISTQLALPYLPSTILVTDSNGVVRSTTVVLQSSLNSATANDIAVYTDSTHVGGTAGAFTYNSGIVILNSGVNTNRLEVHGNTLAEVKLFGGSPTYDIRNNNGTFELDDITHLSPFFSYSTVGGVVIATTTTISPLSNTILAVNGSGVIVSTTIPSGTPGGSSGQIQYNNSGSFGGILSVVTSSSVTITTTTTILGTNTSDNANSGYIGEYSSATVNNNTNCPTTAQWGNNASVTLGSGDWELNCVCDFIQNGATVIRNVCGCGGTVTGNDSTGLTFGDNAIDSPVPDATKRGSISIPSFRVQPTSTTTYYLKINCQYTVATETYDGRISARRMR